MHNRSMNVMLMVGFVICWSSGFIGSRLADEAPVSAMDLFAWRFLAATLIAALWWALSRQRGATLIGWFREMLVGALTMGGYLLCVMLAIDKGVSAGATALITAQQPLLAALLLTLWLREQMPVAAWIGMGVASSGVAMCIASDWQGSGNASGWAYALPVLSVISVTVGSVIATRRPSGLAMPATLTAQLTAASLIFLLAALGDGRLESPGSGLITWQTLGWLIVMSSFGGYGFFTLCLRRVGVNAVSSAIYLTPPVTLLWTAWMFGERIHALQLGGMGLALMGVAIALIAQHRFRRLGSWAH